MGAPAAAAAGVALRGGAGARAVYAAGGAMGPPNGGDRDSGGAQDGGGGGRKLLAILFGFLLGALVVIAVLVSIFALNHQRACNPSAITGGPNDSPDLTTVQIAQKIYAVAVDMQVSDKLIISAFVTGLVESGGGVEMRNLPCDKPGDCDLDSVGVFQQRDMQPWNKRNRRNVSEAARTYFEVALTVDQPGLSAGDVSFRTQDPNAMYEFRYHDPATHQRAAALLRQIRQGLAINDAPAGGRPGKPSTSARPQDMIWPTAVHTVSSPFGPRPAPCLGCSSNHQGLDISAAHGDPVHAVLQGVVITRGVVGGYGNLVCVRHSGQLTTCYAHLSRFGKWQINDTVAQGAIIGYVGSTGSSTAPHLHFEVRLGPSSTSPAVNPAPYLDGAGDATGGDDGLVAMSECAFDEAEVAESADLTGAVKVSEPREMGYLPAWATADGYSGAGVDNGRAMLDARLIPSVLFLLKHYNVRVHDCLAADHETHGAGNSCDIVPADDPNPRPGRMTPGWANVTRLAKDLGWKPPGPGYPRRGSACNSGAPYVPAIAFICYDGDGNHGTPEGYENVPGGRCDCPHLHVTFKAEIRHSSARLATPGAWVMTFPLDRTADASPPGSDAPTRGAPTVTLIGDSLGEGIRDALAQKLRGYTFRAHTQVGMTLGEGMRVARNLNVRPRVLAFSLFTNDDPRNAAQLADAVRQSTTLVAPGGCVVWATIARAGYDYRRANDKLRSIAAEHASVVLVDWADLVGRGALTLTDGVHATPAGYLQRAERYARAIKGCSL
jgi:murein DD-endopeptidase MepM/ murein hydrolase activator NlpD